MADYWIKAYHEILDDPKMATLPDRLWRRVMEIFLLAGRLSKDKSGHLPDTNQLAWLLRMDADDLETDLRGIEEIGIIEKSKTGWFVKRFEERQAAVRDAERKRQQRERDNKNKYYGGDEVTGVSRDVTQINRIQNTETETETEQIQPRAAEPKDKFDILQDAIEQVIGMPQGLDAIKTINELIAVGAEVKDIQDAAAWYQSQNKTIRSAGQLLGPAKESIRRRKQAANIPIRAPDGRGGKGGLSAAELMLQEVMNGG